LRDRQQLKALRKELRETIVELDDAQNRASEHYEQSERYYQDSVFFLQTAKDLDALYRWKLTGQDLPGLDDAIAAIQKKLQVLLMFPLDKAQCERTIAAMGF